MVGSARLMSILYAIGDIHGRLDLLDPLLEAIENDAARRRATPRIVFLGDIIDRGPQSRQALDRVIATIEEHPGSHLILGNHEEFLLHFLEDAGNRERIARIWLTNGGQETLASYGFGERERVNKIAKRFSKNFAPHVEALRAADWMVTAGRYCFVHGGVDPAIPIADQDPETTRWIRHDFLGFTGPLEKTVVHGHTPTESFLPEVHSNRIAIDTGAFMSGHLTCAILRDDAAPEFLATDDSGGRIEVAAVRPVSFP